MSLDLRVPSSVLIEHQDYQLVWEVIAPAYQHVDIYNGPEELAKTIAPLTPGQRALLALHWCVAEVCNGGFDQFFTNSTGVIAPVALEGAQRTGAQEMAELLRRAYSAFPGGSPSQVREEREEFLESLDEDARDGMWESLDEAFYVLMDSELYPKACAYVRTHPEEFVRLGS